MRDKNEYKKENAAEGKNQVQENLMNEKKINWNCKEYYEAAAKRKQGLVSGVKIDGK